MNRIQTENERPGGRPPSDSSTATTPGPAPVDVQSDKLIDVDLFVDYAGFVARALRRHFIIAFLTFALVFGAIWGAAMLWPKAYQADGRLLVQRNEVMASLVNPGRTIPREAETPTRAAEEIVRGRENLLAIIKETNLLEEWERTRAPLLKFKDRVFRRFRGEVSEGDRLDAMVGLLEARLQIGATEEGAVSFVLRWPDPQMARQLVDKAMQSFLNYRRVSETSAITDSITILDRSVEALEAQVNTTISQLPRRSASALRPPVRQVEPTPVAPITPLPSGPSPETLVRLARLKSALEARQQEIARLDAGRSQQLAEAQARLSAAQTIYTEGHPTVLSLRQTVSQLSRDSVEVAAARREALSLEAEYDSLSTRASAETEHADQARAMMAQPRPAAPSQLDLSSLINGNDPSEPISLRLRVEMAELAAVRERANAARAELSSSQAGFKHQYSVLRPPQVPRQPVSPNLPAVLIAGAIASLLLALAVAVSTDLASGLVLEAWQLERQLGVPVTIKIPTL